MKQTDLNKFLFLYFDVNEFVYDISAYISYICIYNYMSVYVGKCDFEN